MSREREGKGRWHRETCRKSCLEAQSQHPKPITAVRGRQGEWRGPDPLSRESSRREGERVVGCPGG